jgi:hypothetical protein
VNSRESTRESSAALQVCDRVVAAGRNSDKVRMPTATLQARKHEKDQALFRSLGGILRGKKRSYSISKD